MLPDTPPLLWPWAPTEQLGGGGALAAGAAFRQLPMALEVRPGRAVSISATACLGGDAVK